MTRLEIDPEDLIQAMTWTSEMLESSFYLDSETGAVLLDSPDVDELPEDFGEDPRYLYIEPTESHLAYEAMQDFVDTLPEGRLADALQQALEGRKPFRQFKDALLDYPDARESWFRFKGDFELRQAAAWCAAHDIEPVWRRKTSGG